MGGVGEGGGPVINVVAMQHLTLKGVWFLNSVYTVTTLEVFFLGV